MTGTSIDAVDAALVEITGAGLAMSARLVRHASRPLGDLAPRLRKIAQQHACTAREIAAAGRDLALEHVRVLRALVRDDKVDFIAVHGQTVLHAPPLSWQLINPHVIAEALHAPVVFDLRAADLAAGGQGAPITPIADYVLFAAPHETRTVVNLGGFCNITRLPRRSAAPDLSEIGGGDVCVCNQLLDALARSCLGSAFDEDGRRALAGAPLAAAVSALQAQLERQAAAGRSLGTGDEALGWLDQYRGACTPEDLARSACAAIARVIAQRLAGADRIILAGGGARNAALVAELSRSCGAEVSTSSELGVPVEAREALCFAVLGALARDGVPIALPAITGAAGPRVAGAWVDARPPGAGSAAR